MYFARRSIMLVALLLVAPPGHAAQQASPVGRWLTQDKEGVIAIEPCGNELCGRVVGVTIDHPNDPFPTDNQGRSQCGLTIIRGAVPDGNQGWNARITDPRDGKIYQARLWLGEHSSLHVRGYVGIPLLGRTVVWTPFHADIGDNCRLPSATVHPARIQR